MSGGADNAASEAAERRDVETILAYRQALLGRGGATAEAEAQALGERVNQVFARHWDMVYAVCRRYVGDPERARDLAQDAMLRAFSRLAQFRGDSRFGTWLYTIARSVCLSALRRPGELLVQDGVLSAVEPAADALRRLRRDERFALMRAVMVEALTPQEQEAVYLRYVEKLPQDTITSLLEIDQASGARGVLQRCRRKLRRELRRRLDELGLGSSFVRSSV